MNTDAAAASAAAGAASAATMAAAEAAPTAAEGKAASVFIRSWFHPSSSWFHPGFSLLGVTMKVGEVKGMPFYELLTTNIPNILTHEIDVA